MTPRDAWRKLLRHARVFEVIERLQRIEARLDVEEAPAAPVVEPISELQHYPGYAPADLAVLEEFRLRAPRPEPGFIVDFIGVRTRATSLWREVQELAGTVVPPPVPSDFHAEAVEWIGLLKAVKDARDQFVMMELGAGWGPWLVAGATAARARGIREFRLLGVDADEGHVRFMRQHIADNGFDPEAQTLVHGAVGPEPGVAKFPRLPDPANDFGSRPMQAAEGDYAGREFAETVDVEVLGIAVLLQREPLWDLVHIDVQGGETALCERAIDLLAERARWVIIGTHSRKIDGDLVDMFTRHGWKLEHEKPSRFIFRPAMPTLDAMTTHDGTQVWRNPRIA